MYYRQQNICYPQRLLAPFEATIANLLARNNINQIC